MSTTPTPAIANPGTRATLLSYVKFLSDDLSLEITCQSCEYMTTSVHGLHGLSTDSCQNEIEALINGAQKISFDISLIFHGKI